METIKTNTKFYIKLVVIFLAMLVAACIIAYGLKAVGMQSQRYIAVKGLNEKKVTADLASWSLEYSTTGNNIQNLNKATIASFNKIKAYFEKYGFSDDQIKLQSTYLTSLDTSSATQYNASVAVSISTNNIENMKAASANMFDLYNQGVLFSSYSSPKYTFTNINNLKPQMVAEAIENAKVSALKFAESSKIVLGGLKNANQGYFEFLPSDRSSLSASSYPEQILRVVVSASYYLK